MHNMWQCVRCSRHKWCILTQCAEQVHKSNKTSRITDIIFTIHLFKQPYVVPAIHLHVIECMYQTEIFPLGCTLNVSYHSGPLALYSMAVQTSIQGWTTLQLVKFRALWPGFSAMSTYVTVVIHVADFVHSAAHMGRRPPG